MDQSLRDLGKSAFSGDHVEKGALGEFIKRVNRKEIPSGSYLLVENLDRLSRESVMVAFTQFASLINAGIIVVTLGDNQVFKKGEIQDMNLMFSLLAMSRAHEESAVKSNRLLASWEQKRAKISTRKLTALCPAWMKMVGDGQKFELIPDRTRIVKRIFKLAREGRGRRLIANLLNREKIEPWGKGKRRGDGWHDSYVAKILDSKAVLGTFHPHKMNKAVIGGRIPVGEEVPDYFPRVISDELFYAVKHSKRSRRNFGGRVDDKVSNLFSGITVCSQCGGSVTLVDKGGSNGCYLRCSRANRGVTECQPRNWNYEHFEALFIEWIVDFDFTSSEAEMISDKRERIASAVAQLDDLQKRIERLHLAIETGEDGATSLMKRVGELERQKTLHSAELERLQGEVEIVISRKESDSEIKLLAQDPANRHRLRQEIRNRVARIKLYFGGDPNHPTQDEGRFFVVTLHDGTGYDIFGSNSGTVRRSGKTYRLDPNDPNTD